MSGDWEEVVSSLTVRERVLVHLAGLPAEVAKYEADVAHTQAGIAGAVGIERKHVPRAIKALKNEGLVDVMQGRALGSSQRQMLHILTPLGLESAKEISQVHGINTLPTPDISAEKHRSENDRIRALSILQMLLRRAWSDGRLTIEEEALIQEAALAFRVGPETLEVMTADERKAVLGDNAQDVREVYRELLRVSAEEGMDDVNDDHPMFAGLRRALGLDEREHSSLALDVRLETEGLEDARLRAYFDALCTAWGDGGISEDENAILLSLRNTFNITADEERALIRKVRDRLT